MNWCPSKTSLGPVKFHEGITVVGVPTRVPQYAAETLKDAKFQAKISSDSAKLREVFKFDNPPYAALIERPHSKLLLRSVGAGHEREPPAVR